MACIYFVAPFRPITGHIAEYTSFITRELSPRNWRILCFDPATSGATFIAGHRLMRHRLWHGSTEPTYDTIPSIVQQSGVDPREGIVLWFQHENTPWPNEWQLIEMLKCLDLPKVITFHSLHFESSETPLGLRKAEFTLLERVLPHVEAITVFSEGARGAIAAAFAHHAAKVHLLRYGVSIYPHALRMTPREAKKTLHEFLVNCPELGHACRKALEEERIFLDPDTFVIGNAGFVAPRRHSDRLFMIRDILQQMLPRRRIVALRIATPQDEEQATHMRTMKLQQDQVSKFLIETQLPESMIPIALRAFDVNFCWPGEGVSGNILSRILGSGGVIAGQDLEETGETLKEAGAIAERELGLLVFSIYRLAVNPEEADRIRENAIAYATRFSWEKQARIHRALAERLAHPSEITPLPRPSDRSEKHKGRNPPRVRFTAASSGSEIQQG